MKSNPSSAKCPKKGLPYVLLILSFFISLIHGSESPSGEPPPGDSNSHNVSLPRESVQREKAPSLEEILKTEVPELARENSATNDNWRRLVEALAKNEFDAANGYARTLINTREVLSPMRLEYCIVYQEITKTEDANTQGFSPTLNQILEIDRKLENLSSENQALLEERPKVYKKIEDKNRAKATSALIGSLIGAGLGAGLGAAAGGGDAAALGAGAGAALGAAGGYGYAAADSPEVRLQYIERRLQEISIEKPSAEAQKTQLRLQLTAEEKQREMDSDRARLALRERVLRLMDRLSSENEFQPSVAIANAFLKLRGMDSAVSLKSSEIYQEQSRVAKVVKIAKAIEREVEEVLGRGSKTPKPWTASSELGKKLQMAKQSIQDEKYVRLLEKELFSLREELETTKTTADKQRNDLLSLGERNAEEAFPQLESYGAFYQDDPNYNTAWLKMKDLRQKQAEARVEYYMQAVTETLENDPEKAKILLISLLGKEVPPIEKVILESKISAAFRRIHQKEIRMIRKDLDEAQGYLTKYSLQTGSSLAEVNLSSLQGQVRADTYEDLENSKTTLQGGAQSPILPITANIDYQDTANQKTSIRQVAGDIDDQKRVFSFAGRLFVGVENVERCLSLLEGANVRAKHLQKDENLDKVLAGRLDGLAKSIEVSLEQVKGFRDKEIGARKLTWTLVTSGVCLTALAGTGGAITLARRKS